VTNFGNMAGSAGLDDGETPVVIDSDVALEYLRDMLGLCLDSPAWAEGEFLAEFSASALEVLTTLAGLDRWLSEGGHLPLVWANAVTPSPYPSRYRVRTGPVRRPVAPVAGEGAPS
jgi:hypothetical protein